MTAQPMRVVVLGLSLSSSWGNGHATTYRALLKAFAARGNQVTFLERDVPWYSGPHRDLANPDWCDLVFYKETDDLKRHRASISEADAVIVGSYVPDGIEVGRIVQDWAHGVTAFYDIDTPVTLGRLARGEAEYISPALIPGYDLYLSFTGGPTLDLIERRYGSPAARALYCSVDPASYPPQERERRWDLSYLGTYSPDRQPVLERLLIEPARRLPQLRFVVAGPQYPVEIEWPANVERFQHVGPVDHPEFYACSRYTLNVTRADMVAAGWSPSVRLFEAASCAVPVISDVWPGIDDILTPGREILLAASSDDIVSRLIDADEDEPKRIGEAARERILTGHTAACRAAELEAHLREAIGRGREPVSDVDTRNNAAAA